MKPALPFLLLVLLWVLPVAAPAADLASPLVLERTIPLAGVPGRIDHLAVDLRRQRLFVAELGNGTVDAIDLRSGTVVHRISNLKKPQGLGYSPAADVLAVASAGDGSVRFFRGEDLAPEEVVNLGTDADNVRLDARTHHLVVGFGGGGLAVLDPTTFSEVRRIRLAAHPEGFQLDQTGEAFVNVPDARQIAVVDVDAGTQVATWPTRDLRSNFPMAFDGTHAVVATVFRNPARLVLLSARSGQVVASMATCRDADDVFFDSARHRLYVSCGEGVLDILRQDSAGHRRLGRMTTVPGARTSLFVPELDRLFVAAPRASLGAGSDAAILVFRPNN